MKRIAKLYVVKIFSQTYDKWIETTETSLRACIALVYGLTTDYRVTCNGAVMATYTDVAGFLGIGAFTYASKQWKHNVRAFKCTLRPTFQDKLVFGGDELAVWDNTDTMDV